jgi:hypothetical protein
MEDSFASSRSTKEHKFFEKYLDNDLEDLSQILHDRYERITSGIYLKNPLILDGDFSDSGSVSTSNYLSYNVFQFYHPATHRLLKAVKEMTIDACEYYGLDFDKEQYMIQGWFNINDRKTGKLNWHDHPGGGAPFFHGYYCVKAEPTITNYMLFGKEIVENVNKNNRAILSETGHPHAMGDWDWEGPRITIAYDVLPLRSLYSSPEQHFLPLL